MPELRRAALEAQYPLRAVNHCVEVTLDGDPILMRNFTHPDVVLQLTPDQWRGFILMLVRPSKITRIEKAQRAGRPATPATSPTSRIQDDSARDRLMRLARDSRKSAWWQSSTSIRRFSDSSVRRAPPPTSENFSSPPYPDYCRRAPTQTR